MSFLGGFEVVAQCIPMEDDLVHVDGGDDLLREASTTTKVDFVTSEAAAASLSEDSEQC